MGLFATNTQYRSPILGIRHTTDKFTGNLIRKVICIERLMAIQIFKISSGRAEIIRKKGFTLFMVKRASTISVERFLTAAATCTKVPDKNVATQIQYQYLFKTEELGATTVTNLIDIYKKITSISLFSEKNLKKVLHDFETRYLKFHGSIFLWQWDSLGSQH